MLILVGLGLSSYFLAKQAERMASRPADRTVAHEPDYFVDRIKVLKVDESGAPSLRIEARRMRHFPDDKTFEFDAPRVVTLAPDRPEVTVSALRGVGPDDGSTVELIGEVRIERKAEPPSGTGPGARPATRPLSATTNRATVLLEQRVVTTDQAVDIDIGGDRLAGTGMRLDSDARRLEIDSAVRGTVMPRPRDALP